MWRPEANVWESILPFHHESLGMTEVIRFDGSAFTRGIVHRPSGCCCCFVELHFIYAGLRANIYLYISKGRDLLEYFIGCGLSNPTIAVSFRKGQESGQYSVRNQMS